MVADMLIHHAISFKPFDFKFQVINEIKVGNYLVIRKIQIQKARKEFELASEVKRNELQVKYS